MEIHLSALATVAVNREYSMTCVSDDISEFECIKEYVSDQIVPTQNQTDMPTKHYMKFRRYVYTNFGLTAVCILPQMHSGIRLFLISSGGNT